MIESNEINPIINAGDLLLVRDVHFPIALVLQGNIQGDSRISVIKFSISSEIHFTDIISINEFVRKIDRGAISTRVFLHYYLVHPEIFDSVWNK